MIQSSDLQNRAVTGAECGPRGGDEVTEVIRRIGPAKPDPRADLAQLRERIAQARGIMAPRGSCCGHCFGSGAAAVLRILDGEA